MVQLVKSKIKTATLEIGQVCIVTGKFPEENKIRIDGRSYQYRASCFEPYIIPVDTEVIVLGEDKYFEEGAGQAKYLSKKGKVLTHYVTQLENDPVYQVAQGKNSKDTWFYCEDNVLPVSMIEQYVALFGEISTFVEKKVDVAALIETERLKFCTANRDYSSAASYLIVDQEGDHSAYYNRVCHGPVNSPVGTEQVAVVYNLQHDWQRSSAELKKYLPAFWEYIVNRSPWAYGFIDKELNLDRGLLVNIDIHPMEVRTVCMALRSGYESGYAKRWAQYVKSGFTEDFALLCCLSTLDMTHFSGFSGSHFPFGGNVKAHSILKFFALGREAFPKSILETTYRNRASSTVSADSMYNLISVDNQENLANFFRKHGIKEKGASSLDAAYVTCSRDVLLKIQEEFTTIIKSYFKV